MARKPTSTGRGGTRGKATKKATSSARKAVTNASSKTPSGRAAKAVAKKVAKKPSTKSAQASARKAYAKGTSARTTTKKAQYKVDGVRRDALTPAESNAMRANARKTTPKMNATMKKKAERLTKVSVSDTTKKSKSLLTSHPMQKDLLTSHPMKKKKKSL